MLSPGENQGSLSRGRGEAPDRELGTSVLHRQRKSGQQGNACSRRRHLRQGRKTGGAKVRLPRVCAPTQRERLISKAVTVSQEQHPLPFQIARVDRPFFSEGCVGRPASTKESSPICSRSRSSIPETSASRIASSRATASSAKSVSVFSSLQRMETERG